MLRVAYLLSHPIQYQSPLLRRLAQHPGLDLTVFYTSDFSLRAYRDQGFGQKIEWDVPLLGGYRHEVFPRLIDADFISFFRPLNRGIFKRLRSGQFDVLWIHGYATLNSWMAMTAAKRLGIPVLLRTDSTLIDHVRGRAKLALKKVFFHILRRFTFGVLSVGERNSEYWRHHLGATIPIFSIPYAVDNAFFQQQCQAASATREDLRRELQVEADRPIILFASKLLARKRCIDLVEAFLELLRIRELQSHTGVQDRPRPYLLIVGDGEERTRIDSRIRAAGAQQDIRMTGFRNQSELPRYYDLCDVFVLPSIHEPWGLVINEVMNAGRAVIVSDEVGCQPDLVSDGENGCVFQARNVPALAAALERILANSEMRRSMGVRSRERIEQFSFDRNVEGLVQAFTAAKQQAKSVKTLLPGRTN
ncbi:MAG TPA: glycosyltransferase family 4 protein [Acidobacteriaceae bacterium]|nr:glycosyltransferase family 4 protein [Acidobacteriaceae bacterium]